MNRRRKVIAGSVAALAVAGGGGAIAASWPSPSERSQALINDAASQLGVSPSKLSDALKKAYEDQIDADVAAGRLTQAQGDAMKAKIEAGVPLLGGPGPGFGFGRHGGMMFGHGDELATAASYLGLTQAELMTQLQSGKTLAQIANATSGKSADGLIDALVAAEKKELDAAVAAGKLTQAQADQIESGLKQRITEMVNGTFPVKPFGGMHGMRADFGPPGIE